MPEKFRIEISPAAMNDITSIWQRIAEDSPATATKFILALQKQTATLEEFPRRCPTIPEAVESDIPYQHLIYGNYRTLFSVKSDISRIAQGPHSPRIHARLPPSSRRRRGSSALVANHADINHPIT